MTAITKRDGRKKHGRTMLRPHPVGLVIDDADRYLIDGWGVWLDGSGYPTIRYDGRDRALHRVIMGPTERGMEIDHINRNKLDCRRSNLRVVSKSVNQHNIQCYRKSKTGIAGVFPKGARFLAQIKHDGKPIRIGLFDTVAEAADNVRAFKIALGVWRYE